MKIRLEHGLAYVEAVLTFRGRSLFLHDTILDTGSSSTIFAADRLLERGIVPEPSDSLHRLRGVGGTEYAFTKHLDLLAVGDMEVHDFEIEVGEPYKCLAPLWRLKAGDLTEHEALELGIPRATFYRWKRGLLHGGLKSHP